MTRTIRQAWWQVIRPRLSALSLALFFAALGIITWPPYDYPLPLPWAWPLSATAISAGYVWAVAHRRPSYAAVTRAAQLFIFVRVVVLVQQFAWSDGIALAVLQWMLALAVTTGADYAPRGSAHEE